MAPFDPSVTITATPTAISANAAMQTTTAIETAAVRARVWWGASDSPEIISR